MSPEFPVPVVSVFSIMLLLNKRLFPLLEEVSSGEKKPRGELGRLLSSISRRERPLLAEKRLLKKHRNMSLIEAEWSWISLKISAIVDDNCGHFFGSEEEVIHGMINIDSPTVSDDSSESNYKVSERTHSELELEHSESNELTSSEDDVEDNERDNLISNTM